jgi:hypothetical protein
MTAKTAAAIFAHLHGQLEKAVDNIMKNDDIIKI